MYPGVAGSSHNTYQFWVVSRSLPFDDLSEYQTAITDYTKAIQLDPDYAKAYNNRAWAYYYLEQYTNQQADETTT